MKDRNITLAKNTLILGFGQLVPKFIAIITLPIFTRYLSTDGYGIYDMVLSIGALAIPVTTLLIQQAAFRFLISGQNDKTKVVTSTFGVVAILMSLWMILVAVAAFSGLYDKSFLFLVFMFYLAESLYDVSGQIIRGLGKNFTFSIGAIIYSVGNLVFVLVLLAFHTINERTIIFISTLSYMISFLFICVQGEVFGFVKLTHFSWGITKNMLQYSLPIIPSSISLWVVNLSDRLIVTSILGTALNGIYAAANKIPHLCGTAYSIFNLAWTEVAARTVDDDDRNAYYTDLYNNLFAFLIGAFLLLIVFSPIIFRMLIAESFCSGLQQIPILFVGIFFSSMVSFYGGIYVALKRTKQVGISSTIGAVLNILINVLLIKKIGLYAASISTLVSYLLIYWYRKKDISKFVYIAANKQMEVTGYIFLITVCSLYYVNTTAMFVVGIICALYYNIKYNGPAIRSILSQIRKKGIK